MVLSGNSIGKIINKKHDIAKGIVFDFIILSIHISIIIDGKNDAKIKYNLSGTQLIIPTVLHTPTTKSNVIKSVHLNFMYGDTYITNNMHNPLFNSLNFSSTGIHSERHVPITKWITFIQNSLQNIFTHKSGYVILQSKNIYSYFKQF